MNTDLINESGISKERRFWCNKCGAGPFKERGAKSQQTANHKIKKYDLFENDKGIGPDNQDIDCPIEKEFIRANNAARENKVLHLVSGVAMWVHSQDDKIIYTRAKGIASEIENTTPKKVSPGITWLFKNEHSYDFTVSEQSQHNGTTWRFEKD